MTYKVSTYEIVSGIGAGIVPDKPGIYFNLFREHLKEVNRSIREYNNLIRTKYELSETRYRTFMPPKPERELGKELADRRKRLFDLAHRHLTWTGLLVPEEEKIKYAREEPGYVVTRRAGTVIAKEPI